MIRALVVGLIRGYQAAVSPLLPASCRFVPTCSEYARLAVERHGPWRGSRLAVRRLLRCHPFGGHGYDPVPGAGSRDGTPEAEVGPPVEAPGTRS